MTLCLFVFVVVFFFFVVVVVVFCTGQEVCSKLQNQAKCDSADFKTIPLKSYCFLHFLIDRTGYNS